MAKFWRKGADNLRNGAVLGAIAGFIIWQGAGIYTWLLETIPPAWYVLGDLSLPIYLIVVGALVGYMVDRM